MLKEKTTLDSLLGGRVKLEQGIGVYRAGLDAVLLAAAVPAHAGERLLELGLGAGAAGLCLLSRVECQLTGIEKDPQTARIASRNAEANGAADKLHVVCGDIADVHFEKPFDGVFCNPPYHDTRQHGDGAGASHMPLEALGSWISVAFRNLKDSGHFTIIHRADALSAILAGLGKQPAGAIKILPVTSYAGEPARRVIVLARRSRKTPLELLSPLIVHDLEGGYNPDCEAVLRNGAALLMER